MLTISLELWISNTNALFTLFFLNLGNRMNKIMIIRPPSLASAFSEKVRRTHRQKDQLRLFAWPLNLLFNKANTYDLESLSILLNDLKYHRKMKLIKKSISMKDWWTDRLTDGWTGGQNGMWSHVHAAKNAKNSFKLNSFVTDGQTDRWMGRLTNKQADCRTNRPADQKGFIESRNVSHSRANLILTSNEQQLRMWSQQLHASPRLALWLSSVGMSIFRGVVPKEKYKSKLLHLA